MNNKKGKFSNAFESHKLQNKTIKWIGLFVRKKPRRTVIIQNKNMSYAYKRTPNMSKIKKIYFNFLRKTPFSKPVKSQRIFKKNSPL